MNARHTMLVGLIAVAIYLVPVWKRLHSEDRSSSQAAPIISRGFIDAPSGTAILAGDPAGGATILEISIREGQAVKRDQILVVLSNYPNASKSLGMAESNVKRVKLLRESLLTGPSAMNLALRERELESTILTNKLAALKRARSAKPADERQIEVDVAERQLNIEKASLQLQKQIVANALATNEIDIANAEANVGLARVDLEAALVRSPLDGVVVQIFVRKGENVPWTGGIAKIVDMQQLRVLADVDEQLVGSLKLGGRAEVTFRGAATVHRGKISRIAPALKRMQQADPNTSSATDARVVQVEVELDDPSTMPQVLGREARITFLPDS